MKFVLPMVLLVTLSIGHFARADETVQVTTDAALAVRFTESNKVRLIYQDGDTATFYGCKYEIEDSLDFSVFLKPSNTSVMAKKLDGAMVYICGASRLEAWLGGPLLIQVYFVELEGRVALYTANMLTGFIHFVEKIDGHDIYLSPLAAVNP